MINEYKNGKITWIDVHSPTGEEIEKLKKTYQIHSLVAEDLKVKSLRSKLDSFKKHTYLILHFPIYKHDRLESDTYEVDFLIGKDFVITTHYQEAPVLNKFAEYYGGLDKEDRSQIVNSGHVFFFLLRFLYRSQESNLEQIQEELDIAEEEIFHNNPKNMVEYLAVLNHNVLDFKRALKSHGPILDSLKHRKDLFDDDFQFYITSLYGEYQKIWNMTEDSKELVKDLQETNDSLLNTRSNEVVKNLTLMAFITFPLTLIASIFGMNTSYMPIVGNVNDFWIVIGIMLVGMAFMLAWFRHKRWL